MHRPSCHGPTMAAKTRGGGWHMRQYELMLILDNDLEERTLADTVNNLIKVVPAENGTVDNADIWGRRRFAYELRQETEGYYVAGDFHAERATTKERARPRGLNESALRRKVLRPNAQEGGSAPSLEGAFTGRRNSVHGRREPDPRCRPALHAPRCGSRKPHRGLGAAYLRPPGRRGQG